MYPKPLLFIGDGLKRLLQRSEKVYPVADFQSCILHKVRNSLSKVREKHREIVAEDVQQVTDSATRQDLKQRQLPSARGGEGFILK